jgi:hypothetical protein
MSGVARQNAARLESRACDEKRGELTRTVGDRVLDINYCVVRWSMRRTPTRLTMSRASTSRQRDHQCRRNLRIVER